MSKEYSAVAFIPFKEKSERVPGKNFRELEGKPLYQYIIENAKKSKSIEEVFVCTNSESAKKSVRDLGAQILDCPDWYFEGSITGDKLLSYPAEKINSGVYVQLFVTAPFLRPETIDKSVQILEESTDYDSVLTVLKRNEWVWYKGNPITYYPGNLPRSQDAYPIMVETTGLYACKNNVATELKRRVGNKPYFLEVDRVEGWDIDEPLDFKLAELFMKNIKDIKNAGIIS